MRAPSARVAATALLIVSAALLQACVSRPPPLAGHVYSGRLAVRTDASAEQDAHAVSGQFELSGNASSGQLVLTSPLGTTVARARWSRPEGTLGEPSLIELEADGATRRYATLGEMMQRAIGDQLPLAAMFDWLAARPWPAAAAQRAADGQSFEQLGWQVDLSRFAATGLISATRSAPPPTLHVLVKLDAAEPAASAAAVPGP